MGKEQEDYLFTVEDMSLDDKFSLKTTLFTNHTSWNKYPIIMKFKGLVRGWNNFFFVVKKVTVSIEFLEKFLVSLWNFSKNNWIRQGIKQVV